MQEDADVAADGAQFLHVVITTALDPIYKRPAKSRPAFLQFVYSGDDLLALVLVECEIPL